MPGLRSEMPLLLIDRIEGHPFLRGLITVDGRLGVLVRRDALYGAMTLPGLDHLIEHAARFTDQAALDAWWLDQHWTRGRDDLRLYDDLLDVLIYLRESWEGKFFFRSPREQAPAGRGLNRMIRAAGNPDEELCRDDECSGQHLWLLKIGTGRELSYAWHLNLESCRIVPPEPLVFGR